MTLSNIFGNFLRDEEVQNLEELSRNAYLEHEEGNCDLSGKGNKVLRRISNLLDNEKLVRGRKQKLVD